MLDVTTTNGDNNPGLPQLGETRHNTQFVSPRRLSNIVITTENMQNNNNINHEDPPPLGPDDSLTDNSRESVAEDRDRYRDELTSYHMAGLDTRSAGTNTRAERAQVALEATKSLMKKLVKRHVWRTIKFITNQNQLDSCINKIWDHMPRSYHQTLGYEQRFKDLYRNLAGTILNQVRSEVTTAMRLVVHAYMLSGQVGVTR